MTILDTGVYSLRELRAIELALSRRAMLQAIALETTKASLTTIRQAINRRTQWPHADYATACQHARVVSALGVMPAPVECPIGRNVELPERGMAV